MLKDVAATSQLYPILDATARYTRAKTRTPRRMTSKHKAPLLLSDNTSSTPSHTFNILFNALYHLYHHLVWTLHCPRPNRHWQYQNTLASFTRLPPIRKMFIYFSNLELGSRTSYRNLIPFIVNRYTFYLIPMDLEMAFCGFHYRRTWRYFICFCFPTQDWRYVLYNSIKRGRCYTRCGIHPQALTKYELATNIQTLSTIVTSVPPSTTSRFHDSSQTADQNLPKHDSVLDRSWRVR